MKINDSDIGLVEMISGYGGSILRNNDDFVIYWLTY